jgi:KDO2-lipid IV(A) lauroyltransferase
VSRNKALQTKFKLAFLHPKYWLTWLLVMLMWLISWLPYKLLLAMGRGLGRVFYKLGGKRAHIAARNIELCFPELSAENRALMVKKNFENTGIALFETCMGWFWPDWRVRRKFTIVGLEHLEQAKAHGQGVLLLTMHYLSIEMNCRGMGMQHPTVVFYRPHNNELMEYFQFKGRNRSNKYMLDKRDIRGMLKALDDNETCIYLPDQDYGRKRSLFVPFFGVPAATTKGTLLFAGKEGVKTLMAYPLRNDDDSGYTIKITEVFENFPSGDDAADLLRINQELEKAIRLKPQQYMWLHKRFKNRPDPKDASLY